MMDDKYYDQFEKFRPYFDLLHDTGGNDPIELIKRLNTPGIAQTNIIVYVMATSVLSQLQMLKSLKSIDLLRPRVEE